MLVMRHLPGESWVWAIHRFCLIKAPHNSPAKTHVLCQPALYPHDSFLHGLNPHRAFHAAIHLSFSVFRGELRVWTEIEAKQAFLRAGKIEKKAFGNAFTILMRR